MQKLKLMLKLDKMKWLLRLLWMRQKPKVKQMVLNQRLMMIKRRKINKMRQIRLKRTRKRMMRKNQRMLPG